MCNEIVAHSLFVKTQSKLQVDPLLGLKELAVFVAVPPRHCIVPQPHAGCPCTIQVQLHRRPSLPSDWDKRKPSATPSFDCVVQRRPKSHRIDPVLFFLLSPSLRDSTPQLLLGLSSPLLLLAIVSKSIIEQFVPSSRYRVLVRASVVRSLSAPSTALLAGGFDRSRRRTMRAHHTTTLS